jgi:hypothetical protein
MRRTVPLISLIAALAVPAIGCEPDGGKTAPVGNASALVGEEASATRGLSTAVAGELDVDVGLPSEEEATPIVYEPDAGADPSEHGGSEVAPDPIEAAWNDDAELSAQSTLSFTVTNVTENEEVAFTVSIVSRSLLGQAEIQVAELTLGPGGSEELGLDAADLPVRSDEVVSQMAVGIRRGIASSGWIGGRYLEAIRFYRHEAGLEGVRAYTEEMLMGELDGVLYQSALPPTETSESALESEVLGYVIDASGEPQPVSLADTALVSHDAKGNVDGVTTGYRIVVADAIGEGAIPAPEEDPTVDGPGEHEEEVADE